MNRRTLCHISLGLTALAALVAGITCLALEMPTAGVPLIIVAAILPIGLLERQCPHSASVTQRTMSNKPSARHPESVTGLADKPVAPLIIVHSEDPLPHTGSSKEDNPRPE